MVYFERSNVQLTNTTIIYLKYFLFYMINKSKDLISEFNGNWVGKG